MHRGFPKGRENQEHPLKHRTFYTQIRHALICWAEIDLDALAENVRALKEYIGQDVEIIAVVKANAYGHGAVMVARTALESGASRLAVHRLQEGVELRKHGIKAPILVMGFIPLEGINSILRWNLTPTLPSLNFLLALDKYAQGMVPVHIKVDTGLGRYGFLPSDVPRLLSILNQLHNIRAEGIYTHFACADEEDISYTHYQLEVFTKLCQTLERCNLCPGCPILRRW